MIINVDDIMRKYGLSNAQARSAAVEKILEAHEDELDAAARQNAAEIVATMRNKASALEVKANALEHKIIALADGLQPIIDAANDYGTVTSEKAKDALALYAALLKMNKAATIDGAKAVEAASYVVYAFLGGQAARNIVYKEDAK